MVVAVLKEAHVCTQAVIGRRQLLLQLRRQLIQMQRPQGKRVPIQTNASLGKCLFRQIIKQPCQDEDKG